MKTVSAYAPVVLLLVAFVWYLFLPGVNGRRLPQQILARGQLKYLAVAVEEHERQSGRRLERVIFDSKGRPLYSWRVLILPEFDHAPLYDVFHRDEPWDSPHNVEYSALTESFSHHPNGVLENGLASVLWVYDANDYIPTVGLRFACVADSDVQWSEPRDISFSALRKRLQAGIGVFTGADGPSFLGIIEKTRPESSTGEFQLEALAIPVATVLQAAEHQDPHNNNMHRNAVGAGISN